LAVDLPQASIDYAEVKVLESGQPDIRVLVVDDHRESQHILAHWMESAGFHVALADNGAEALELCKRWQPHFIWMDRRMPVMDGVEATRRIRELAGGKDIRIAAITASALKDDDEELLAAGFNAIVHKPFRRQNIFGCMERLLNVRYEPAISSATDKVPHDIRAIALTALPGPLRKRLADAILRLDQERILEVIDEIAPTDNELAEALRERVKNYAYPSILSLLQDSAMANGEVSP